MADRNWKASADPLLRGDGDPVSTPTPGADPSIVRHILYLDGPGRSTPYISTTEDQSIAKTFAGRSGRVWTTFVRTAKSAGFAHISKSELLQLLKKSGKGKAKWSNAFEVMQARRYVEENYEHLIDAAGLAAEDLPSLLKQIFS